MLIKYSLLFFSSYLCMYVPLIAISYIEDTCKNIYTFSFNTILFLLKRRACYCFLCHPEYGELTQSNTLCHHVLINQKIPLLQGRQFYQDHCQPIAPSTDNSKSYFTSSQKHKNTRFPILSRFFYCFFTIFDILIIINNLLQNLVWSCRFKCTQNWAALTVTKHQIIVFYLL